MALVPVTTDPPLQVGEDDDARMGTLRLVEDRVEVGACRHRGCKENAFIIETSG